MRESMASSGAGTRSLSDGSFSVLALSCSRAACVGNKSVLPRSSNSTRPTAYTSDAGELAPPIKSSGAMYAGVPSACFDFFRLRFEKRAMLRLRDSEIQNFQICEPGDSVRHDDVRRFDVAMDDA